MAQSNLHHHESQVWTEVWRGGGGATGGPGLKCGGGVGEGAAAGWVSRPTALNATGGHKGVLSL